MFASVGCGVWFLWVSFGMPVPALAQWHSDCLPMVHQHMQAAPNKPLSLRPQLILASLLRYASNIAAPALIPRARAWMVFKLSSGQGPEPDHSLLVLHSLFSVQSSTQ
jgi:hypothetical protein